MSKSTPAPPEAPDYGEATREGIYADIETLPVRRRLERGARLGELVNYVDPKTGEDRVADFTGLGDVDLTAAEARGLAAIVPELTQAQLDNLVTFGPQFVKAQREQMAQVDPEGFALREEFGGRLRGGERTAEELVGGIPVPGYEEVSAPTLSDSGVASEGRSLLEEQVFGNLAMDNRLTNVQAQQLEQGVRRAASARGQALGSASGLREAIAKLESGGQLGAQRRGEALNLLASGQTSGDTANRLAQQSFANAMQRVQQVNQARQQGFVGQQQNLGQQLGARQQDIGNIQSLLGLQPVAAQGGLMAGMQQGAAPFMMPQMQRGMGLDPGAAGMGAGFAQNVFGTQGQIFGAQAQMKSPFEKAVGMFAQLGEAASGFGTGYRQYKGG